MHVFWNVCVDNGTFQMFVDGGVVIFDFDIIGFVPVGFRFYILWLCGDFYRCNTVCL